jgi:hypothetical protein
MNIVPNMEALSMESAKSLPIIAHTKVVTYKDISRKTPSNAQMRFIENLLTKQFKNKRQRA